MIDGSFSAWFSLHLSNEEGRTMCAVYALLMHVE